MGINPPEYGTSAHSRRTLLGLLAAAKRPQSITQALKFDRVAMAADGNF